MSTTADAHTRQPRMIRRSRAGCTTCKRRRVKCDETIPACLRCRKARVACEGYKQAPLEGDKRFLVLQFKRPRHARPIFPKVWSVNSSETKHSPSVSTLRPTLVLPGETEVENRYLRYFHQETTTGFAGAWDWTLWNRLVMQGCHNEDFVRLAVVAIGALHKSVRTSSPRGEKGTSATLELAKLHRDFAYLTYGKALKRMQQAVHHGDDGLRHALIACLLVVCFESHTGDRYSALKHAQYGLSILEEERNSESKPGSPGSRRWKDSVEDEIIEAFRNLDIQMITVNEARPAHLHKKAMDEDLDFIDGMPTVFRDLAEARRYWTALSRRRSHFVATTWKRTQPERLIRPFGDDRSDAIATTGGGTIHTTSFVVHPKVKHIQEQVSTEIDRWLAAFEPLFQHYQHLETSTVREQVIAKMLRIQGLSVKINLASVCIIQELLYDEFLPEFREIVQLAGEVVAVRNARSELDFWVGAFQVDLGLAEPLFRLVTRCREPSIRRKALEMLEDWHMEGWWDPLLAGAIARYVMEVEEEGMVDGFIPEKARAVITAKRHNISERRILVQLVQRTGGPGGTMKWHEKYCMW